MASCIGGNHGFTESERSAFGTFVDSLDETLQGQWFSRMGVSDDAYALLEYLRRELPRQGLDTTAFRTAQIAQDLDIVSRLAFDSVGVSINEVLPRLERNLCHAYMRYATGQRYGFMRPDRVFNRLQKKQNREDYARLFDYEVIAPDTTEAFNKMTSSERIDYLEALQPADAVYTALQRRLENSRDKAFRHKLAVNMERCRWQLKHPETADRMVLVNIPAQQLWAVCPDSILDMRICCGAYDTKTPLLASYISYMQVNPEWLIPQNIIDTDVSKHAGDSAYFARNNYYIVDRTSGDTLLPQSVSQEQLESGRLRVGQRGGAGNSLGRIVFRFPNVFSVYLHDTNNRAAFQRDRRTLSHGCVRVQKPFNLACFLLPEADEWQIDRLRISMDMKPETERGIIYVEEHADDERPFRLMSYQTVSPNVPLYIIYYTVYPNPATGELESWPDRYDYDEVIARAASPYLI